MTLGEAINNLALLGVILIPALVIGYLAYMKRLARQIERLEWVLAADRGDDEKLDKS